MWKAEKKRYFMSAEQESPYFHTEFRPMVNMVTFVRCCVYAGSSPGDFTSIASFFFFFFQKGRRVL
jgi:hypothetical protein